MAEIPLVKGATSEDESNFSAVIPAADHVVFSGQNLKRLGITLEVGVIELWSTDNEDPISETFFPVFDDNGLNPFLSPGKHNNENPIAQFYKIISIGVQSTVFLSIIKEK